MFNSRSIPTELWAQARERLIFFFSRRLGLQNAEDLAHNTLLAIWTRKDFEFAQEEDFFRVVHGFARKILQEGYRNDIRNEGMLELDPDLETEVFGVRGLRGAEASTFLEEVRRHGQEKLKTEEWALIEAAANRDEDDQPVTGQIRTKVHRIRKKLAEITGWKKSEV